MCIRDSSKLQQALKPGETFKGRPDHRVLLLIDEFPTLGKMPIFQTAFAYIAGYGIKAYLITQDIEPVSYTHLDVYKRQTRSPCSIPTWPKSSWPQPSTTTRQPPEG